MTVGSIVEDSWYDHEDHPGYTVIPRFVEEGRVGYEVYDRHGNGPGEHVYVGGHYQDLEAFKASVEPADITVHVEMAALTPEAIDP